MTTKEMTYSKKDALELNITPSNVIYPNCSTSLAYEFALLDEDRDVVATGDDVATVQDGAITFKTEGTVRIVIKSNSSIDNIKINPSFEKSIELIVNVNDGLNITSIADLVAYANQNTNIVANFTKDLYLTATENFGEDNKVYNTTVDYYWRKFTYFKTLTKNDKPEVFTWVNTTTKKAGKLGGSDGKKFVASGDAPYAITLKPDPTSAKDKEKVGKFLADPASIDIVQPVYSYLGEVKERGYVVIHGIPKETTKESKLAFTLTAMNPSTKKKGTAKVTANAKTFPAFDKTTNVTIVGDNENDENEYVSPYGSESDDKTYKRIGTKRVEAGKAPSVKPKAKGSKTISYMLGKYAYEDEDEGGELYDAFEGDEYYSHEALAEKLAAVGLSFDAKKGVYAPEKTQLGKPTLNEDKDKFESLDIVITAVNSVGADHAWAHVAITGAKPKMSDKDVTVEGTVKKGDTITFEIMAGKTKGSELEDKNSANVKVTAGDSAATSTLSKYGLALVTYDSMDVIVSDEVSVAANGILPVGFDSKDVVSGHSRSATQEETEGRRYAADAMVIKSGDKWAKSADLSLKNYGILQVINTEALAKVSKDNTANKGVSINLALENLGSTNKGKIKVIIKDTVNGGDPLDPPATQTTNNGNLNAVSIAGTVSTASSTYNVALPEATADAEAEAEAEVTVTVGAPRTTADLTPAQQAYLTAKGYKIIAVLPEISANVEGQQDFDVELDEDAPEGAKLVYIPFPKNAQPSEDDSIADFYDADGQAIEEVPAEKDITVSPWLRENVTYQPVIAAEE